MILGYSALAEIDTVLYNLGVNHMAVPANKRSVMTLFSVPHDFYSLAVGIVLAEKGITVETIQVTSPLRTKELLAINPAGKTPTLVDRTLILYDPMIIMEYLDERFPHPPLLPVYPVDRAKSRLVIHQIERDWYAAADRITKGKDSEVKLARKQLQEYLVKVSPVFAETSYFLGEEFSLVDCYLAPLLYALPKLGVVLPPQAKAITAYAERLFKRPSFKANLTETESLAMA